MFTRLNVATAILVVVIAISMRTSIYATPSVSNSPSGCCTGLRGNVDGVGIVELADLSALISYLTGGGYVPPCMDRANVNGVGIVDLADLSTLVAYLIGLPAIPAQCPPDTSYLSDTIRVAVLTAVNQFASSLDSMSVDSFNLRVLSYIHSRPEFVESGISPEGGNVWARFSDGVLYFISNAFGQSLDTLPGDPIAPDTSAAPAFMPTPKSDENVRIHPYRTATGSEDDLPKSVGFRVMTTLGSAYPAAATTVARLKSWLKSKQYYDLGDLTTVNGLKTVGGEGVFCLITHGSVGKTVTFDTTAVEYGIWTSSPAETIEEIRPYTNDFILRRLCYFSCANNVDVANHTATYATRIGITSKFISWYWHPFSENAIVIIDACASDSVPAFRSAIQAKGGPAYFGWTRSVSCKGACYSTEFLIDRLLGVNKAYPREDPKQRSFPIPEVWSDLTSKGLHVQPGGDGVSATTSTFRYHPGSSNFGLLAPSIWHIDINDYVDTMFIHGKFGSDPGLKGRVMVNGVQRTVYSWTPTDIKCDIAAFGQGSVGPVTVETRGDLGDLTPLTFRESNPVNISEWIGQERYTRSEGGSLHLGASFDIHIRGDIHPRRDYPGGTPILSTAIFASLKDVDASITASGAFTACMAGYCNTYTWSGTTNIPLFDLHNLQATKFFLLGGSLDGQTKEVLIAHEYSVSSGLNQNITSDGPMFHYTYDTPLVPASPYDDGLFDDDMRQLHLTFDDNFRIPSGVRIYITHNVLVPETTNPTANLRLEWDEMVPNFPPDLEEAQ